MEKSTPESSEFGYGGKKNEHHNNGHANIKQEQEKQSGERGAQKGGEQGGEETGNLRVFATPCRRVSN